MDNCCPPLRQRGMRPRSLRWCGGTGAWCSGSVLCELEGRARREVARKLGLPEGTLSSRLATGRKMLAKRLTRHGPEFSSAVSAVVFAEWAAAALPAGLASFTAKAALAVTLGPATVAVPVLALAEGVMKGMLLSKP